jgi:hypothetical protein
MIEVREEAAENAGGVFGLMLLGQHPRDFSNFLALDIINSQLMFWFIVSQENLIPFEIDGLAAHVVAEEMVDGGFDSEIPEVD